MVKKTNKKSSRSRVILVSFAIIAAIGIGYGIYHYAVKPDPVPETPSGVKLAPPTEEEKQQSEDSKQKIVDQQANSDTQNGGKKQVTVTITNATTDNVSSYVSGVLEDGGTCTATFTQGSTTVTRTSSGFSNVSYTQCAPITPSLPSGGSWSVTIKYSSPTSEGTSQKTNL